MPVMFGKESKQQELITNLPAFYKKIQQKYLVILFSISLFYSIFSFVHSLQFLFYVVILGRYNFHESDFPPVDRFCEWLKLVDFSKFPKSDVCLMTQLEEAPYPMSYAPIPNGAGTSIFFSLSSLR
jgi:hypothetical protein